jgi:glycine betaine catabolism B
MRENAGYQTVANKKDFEGDRRLIRVEPDGKPIVLCRVNGKIYAMDAVCSHEGGPLEEGTLEGYELKCPWHYAIFDVRNAKVSEQTVWATDLQSYPVKVNEATGDILVSLQITNRVGGGEEPTAQESTQDSATLQKKYYEEDERKASKIPLKLLSKEKLQDTDIMTFRFSRPGINYTAGQYAFFKLDGVYSDAKGPIRHFSITSSPTEQDYILISTRIRDTPYKQKLASLGEGTEILAWGPRGDFILHDDHSKPAVFLSGGIGVTPFRSMIKYATDSQLPVKIIMFDSNRNEQNILYKSEFDKWTNQNRNFKVIYTLTEEDYRFINTINTTTTNIALCYYNWMYMLIKK